MKQLKNGRSKKLGLKCEPNFDVILPRLNRGKKAKEERDVILHPTSSLKNNMVG